ncbi:MAG: phosphoglycerate kinase [Patescibacteria group bacterium]|nr:phosphoglycerate kinase [Patescibacteria group bacterium]MBU1877052.1 phosphoglycerate kinase [Patescibacteria group bacterium]
MKVLKDFDLKNKKVLVRCDFNVPLSSQGEILNDFRIKQSLSTINYLKKKKAKIILLSHFGRPQQDEVNLKKYSLKPVALRLSKLLKTRILFLPDCIGEKIKEEIGKMKPGKIILLENLRFHKEEEENDSGFAKKLASLGDVYINDAFSACHRAHASIEAITKYITHGAGILLKEESDILTDLLNNPKKPLVAIIGGKKIETKIKLIDSIAEVANWILIGGLLEREIKAKEIDFEDPKKIILAVDNLDGFDIGPKTIELFKKKIKKAKTIFLSGSLGKTEDKKYQRGSQEIIKAIIKSRAFSVAGGGETVEFIDEIGKHSKFGYISTGGGAMLELLSGKELPGIKALENESRN